MGDGTPARGTAAGEGAAPDMLTEGQEAKLLSEAARDVIGSLRFNWGDAYVIGILAGKRSGTYGAWRRDGRGTLLASEDPAELTLLIRADYRACRVPREAADAAQPEVTPP